MAFLARIMAAQGHRRGRYALALREQNRLVLFDLDDLLATGLMHLGRGGGMAVMRLPGHFSRFSLGVLSQVVHPRNCTGFAALHRRLGQQGPGDMTDRSSH